MAISVVDMVLVTCSIKAKVQMHEAPVHRRVICLLLHLGLGLGPSRKQMKGIPHRCV